MGLLRLNLADEAFLHELVAGIWVRHDAQGFGLCLEPASTGGSMISAWGPHWLTQKSSCDC